MKVTDCTCTGPGWCERHQCEKPPLVFQYCQRLPAYFDAWERGELRGLCRATSRMSERKQPCRHLGPERRQAPCQTCQGSVRIKIFECALMGECVRGRIIESLTSCVLCSHYNPTDSIELQPDSTDGTSGDVTHAD